jgi:uncharacterized membrane protein
MILDALLLVAAGFGLAVSVWTAWAMGRPDRRGACPVMKTSFARTLGVPNAWPAALYFAGLAALAADRIVRGPAFPLWPALAATGLALAMSAYLAWRLFFTLNET